MTKVKKLKKSEDGVLTQKTTTEKIVFGIVLGLLIIYCLTLLLPFLWVIVNSFQEGTQFVANRFAGKPFRLPEKWLLSNYRDAFVKLEYNGTNLFGMFFNSVWMTLGVSITSVFTHAVTGYCFAKYDFKAKPVMYFLAVLSLTVPIVGTTAASYKINLFLGLYNNPLGIFVGGLGGFGGNFLIMLAIFKGIPWSYAESVFIDGGNDYTVFFKIMLPQALPAMTTLLVTAIILHWKEYENILMYYPDYLTLSTGLYLVEKALARDGQPTYYAGLILSTVPILVLYVCSCDSMMKNLSVGGLKG